MSSDPSFAAICASERAAALVMQRFSEKQETAAALSPIDDFYIYLATLVLVGQQNTLEQHPVLGKVLLLGLVSATEYYFRSVLSNTLASCPLARAHASGEHLAFGATDYYRPRDLGFALLEPTSFSSGDQIAKQTKRIADLQWKTNSSVATAVLEFDRLCQLRHAAVHARGNLGVKNLLAIAAEKPTETLAVKIDFNSFQDAAEICMNVVRAYNRFIYQEILIRWVKQNILQGTWRKDRARFTSLFNFCYSTHDLRDTLTSNAAYQSTLPFLNLHRTGQALKRRHHKQRDR